MNNIRSSSDHLDQPMMAWWSEGCKLEPFQPKDIPVLLISFDLILNSHCLYHCLMLVSSFSCSLDRFTHHCESSSGETVFTTFIILTRASKHSKVVPFLASSSDNYFRFFQSGLFMTFHLEVRASILQHRHCLICFI